MIGYLLMFVKLTITIFKNREQPFFSICSFSYT